MDTRDKILSVEDVHQRLRSRSARWVSGHFDPLLAEHVRRLRDYTAPEQLLVVEVTNPAAPLLAQRARAELVAALSMVDYVVLANGEASHEGVSDSGIRERFIEHVLRRHRQEQAG